MKRKPVRHLGDCKICFTPKTVIIDGKSIIMQGRNKSICLRCPVYNRCIAKINDNAMKKAFHKINKLKILY